LRKNAVSPDSINLIVEGLTPYTPTRTPNWADPDFPEYHVVSALIFGASAAGRHYSKAMGVTRIPWTASMILVPTFYFLSIHLKEKRFNYTSGERVSFE
jgi:hypothetical protein